MTNAIQPTREENYPEWYQQVVTQAMLAEVSPVRGCMVIKPWGYALWERMQAVLDKDIKATGHENIYCPLFIPLSFLEKEAEHVAGFAKECAVVTHTKLIQNEEGKLVPASPLEAPLVVRPTSETMIGDLFAKWIQSHRDLPLKINQWANIVRWEMRTRLFLRTSEFLWQEGHTAHKDGDEANQHALKMLGVYRKFVENYLAMSIVTGEKSKNERFPGAEITYTLEAMMQDKKALQLGTSHFLGQNFAKGSDITYQDSDGNMQHVYTTSWGVTTRMIGALIMNHSDDDGLVLPPKIAPHQVVILPIAHKNTNLDALHAYCEAIATRLSNTIYSDAPIRVHVDSRDRSGGEKNWSWVKKGVPIRLEVGQREMDADTVSMRIRTRDYKDRVNLSIDTLVNEVSDYLGEIQSFLFTQSTERFMSHTKFCANADEVEQAFSSQTMVLLYWFEDDTIEASLATKYQASIRCFLDEFHPFDLPLEGPACFDKQTKGRLALVAKAY